MPTKRSATSAVSSRTKAGSSRAKKSLIEAPATRRLKKADATTKTRATPARASAAKVSAASTAMPKTRAKKTASRAGQPLAAVGTANRRMHRSATGQRLGPGNGSISGGV